MRLSLVIAAVSLLLAACSSTPPEIVYVDPVRVNEVSEGPFKMEARAEEHELELFVANVEPNKRTTYTLEVSDGYNTRCVWDDETLKDGIDATALQGEIPPSDAAFKRATRLAFVRTCGDSVKLTVTLETGASESKVIDYHGKNRAKYSVMLGRDGILIAEMDDRRGRGQ